MSKEYDLLLTKFTFLAGILGLICCANGYAHGFAGMAMLFWSTAAVMCSMLYLYCVTEVEPLTELECAADPAKDRKYILIHAGARIAQGFSMLAVLLQCVIIGLNLSG
jgi:hypothetical protein